MGKRPIWNRRWNIMHFLLLRFLWKSIIAIQTGRRWCLRNPMQIPQRCKMRRSAHGDEWKPSLSAFRFGPFCDSAISIFFNLDFSTEPRVITLRDCMLSMNFSVSRKRLNWKRKVNREWTRMDTNKKKLRKPLTGWSYWVENCVFNRPSVKPPC